MESSKPTALQKAYANRERKARLLAKRTALLVRAWDAYQKAKTKEKRLFDDAKRKMQSR